MIHYYSVMHANIGFLMAAQQFDWTSLIISMHMFNRLIIL